MQIKTMPRYQFSPIGLAKLKRADNPLRSCRCQGTGTLGRGGEGGVNRSSRRGEHFDNIYEQSVSFAPTVPPLGIYPADILPREQITQVSDYGLLLVHNSKRVGTAQTPLSRRRLK